MLVKDTVRTFPSEQVRRSLDELPDTMDASTNPPDPNELYVVLWHERALDLNSTLVVGDRGSGKSFWSAALNSPVTRALIHAQLPRLHLDRVESSWGFSVSTRNPDHPSRRVLQRLQRDFSVEDIWRAVVLRQLARRYDEHLPGQEWSDVVGYVAENPEHEEGLLNQISDRLTADGKRHLVIFDALDRTGSDWKAIRELVQGLLQVCLKLKGQPGIQAKVFLRPDMLEDRVIWRFPDSSKLHHGRVILGGSAPTCMACCGIGCATMGAAPGFIATVSDRSMACLLSRLRRVTSRSIRFQRSCALMKTCSRRCCTTWRRATWAPTAAADAPAPGCRITSPTLRARSARAVS